MTVIRRWRGVPAGMSEAMIRKNSSLRVSVTNEVIQSKETLYKVDCFAHARNDKEDMSLRGFEKIRSNPHSIDCHASTEARNDNELIYLTRG